MYLLYFVVYNKQQSAVRLSILSSANEERYIVCGWSKMISLILGAVCVIGCCASIIGHSYNGFIVSYLLYAVCDCLYAILFAVTSKHIYYDAYQQFKQHYTSSTSILYAKHMFEVGVKSVIIMVVIAVTHALLCVVLLCSFILD
eukprot:175072_1